MVRGLKNSVTAFVREDDGLTAVEYAVLIGLVVVAVLGSVALLGGGLSSTFTTAGTSATGTGP